MALPLDKKKSTFKDTFRRRIAARFFHLVNKVVPWQKNRRNGHATPNAYRTLWTDPLPDDRYVYVRHSDGKYNDLMRPLSGCTGMRFGRNFNRRWTTAATPEELMHPNPRILSGLSRTHKEFISAATLNLLAAAWIQFQTHDWFKHDVDTEQFLEVLLLADDPWPYDTMTFHPSKPDILIHPTDKRTPGYNNVLTPWWEGSQI